MPADTRIRLRQQTAQISDKSYVAMHPKVNTLHMQVHGGETGADFMRYATENSERLDTFAGVLASNLLRVVPDNELRSVHPLCSMGAPARVPGVEAADGCGRAPGIPKGVSVVLHAHARFSPQMHDGLFHGFVCSIALPSYLTKADCIARMRELESIIPVDCGAGRTPRGGVAAAPRRPLRMDCVSGNMADGAFKDARAWDAALGVVPGGQSYIAVRSEPLDHLGGERLSLWVHSNTPQLGAGLRDWMAGSGKKMMIGALCRHPYYLSALNLAERNARRLLAQAVEGWAGVCPARETDPWAAKGGAHEPVPDLAFPDHMSVYNLYTEQHSFANEVHHVWHSGVTAHERESSRGALLVVGSEIDPMYVYAAPSGSGSAAAHSERLSNAAGNGFPMFAQELETPVDYTERERDYVRRVVHWSGRADDADADDTPLPFGRSYEPHATRAAELNVREKLMGLAATARRELHTVSVYVPLASDPKDCNDSSET